MHSPSLTRPEDRSWPGQRLARLTRLLVNLAGAAGAAFFARASFVYYLHTHRLIGAAFLVEQAWFVIAFLIRRPARASAGRLGPWLLAAAGTFGGLLFRPAGLHPAWGVSAGLVLQLAGLALAVTALVVLGRSFGFVAADRGLVTRGPYAVVRHPVYAAYIVIQAGYLIQAISARNVAVLVFVTGCNIGRAIAEERVLAGSADYEAYRRRVRWRLVPGLF
jgi:protein-S-isoprenylcysteine O-methyltransferase Ste14